MRGRKPLPSNVVKLRGNPGKRRLNNAEPRPAIKAPGCPSCLGEEARKEWKRLAGELAELGLLTTIDRNLLEAADILPYEQVDIYDCTNGNRIQTYAIEGEPGSGEICVNGAAAHLTKPHDLVIICSYVQVEDADCRGWKATRVFCDPQNRPREIA